MKKTSLALLTSLIAGGLLFLGSTNAMTYTVEGKKTSIAIPENTSDGILINRGDGLTNYMSDCNDTPLLGTIFKQCEHNYTGNDSDIYNVSVNNNNNEMVVNVFLNEANITHIDNFNGFPDLNTIYLQHNNISQIDDGIFQGLSNPVIYLDYNKISEFNSSISNIKYLYLTYNSLKTIPEIIRDYDESPRFIRLSSTVGTGRSGGKFIDLSNNEIKFIKIIEVDGHNSDNYEYYQFINPSNYQFGRFGYSNESNSSFDYYILDEQNNLITTNGTTESSIEITDSLEPGEYFFKVCIHNDTDNCDTIRFDVEYTLGIEFITRNPNYGETIGHMNGISFTWQKTGGYPESFISGYNYTLTKDGIEIDSGSSLNNPASYILDTSLIQNNPSGDYTFTVYLVGKEGYTINIVPALTTFTILIDNTIFINSPTGVQYGNGENIKNVAFDWQTSTSLFEYYNYYITSSNSCSESASAITGGTSYEANTIFNYPLGNGNYVLCIDMYDSSNNKLNDITISNSFNVHIPATVSITAPNSTVSAQPIQFTRDSFLPTPYTFINYTYTVKKGNEAVTNGSGTITDQDNRSFSLNNLHDGTYTVNVTMNHSDGSTDDTKTFTVNSSSGVYLNLTPSNGETITRNLKQVPVAFSWEGGGSPLIHEYYYKITNTSTTAVVDSGTKSATDNLTLGIKSLPSGTYRFEVTMLDSDNNQITNSYSDFTVVIPTELTIISPSTGLQITKNITFRRTGFAEFTEHYSYQVKKTGNEIPIKTGYDTSITSFSIPNMINGEYTFTVSLLDNSNNPIKTKSVSFTIPDSQDLTLNISDGQNSVTTLRSKTGIFSRGGESENFDSYTYSVEGTTFKNEHYYTGGTSESTAGNFTLNNLSTGRYRFTVTMLDSNEKPITGKYLDFNVVIPATLKITSHTDGAKITTSNATFTWAGYSDTFTKYEYKLTGQPASFTTSSSFTTTLTNGNYTLSVKLYSGNSVVAQDSIDFTVDIPSTPSNPSTPTNPSTGGGGGGSSSGGGGSSGKTHYNNNLKVSPGNDSPTTNERIDLIVKIDNKYTGKVTFPKLQYYSPDTEKWIDIPVTSKNYVSDYGDEAKLGYIKFTSSDDGRIDIPQFIKFSKNGYYRIYAEDKDGYDEYVEIYVSTKKTVTTNNNTNTIVTTNNPTTTNNNTNANSIIREYLPEIFETKDTQEEVYVARSCKRYTITYSDSLNVYTSPNLNISEYFVSKDYFKRYIDSKNKYQSGCPTNVGWISTNYSDKSNDNSRYTAPNGKVYFITGRDGNYYSNELNKELKTPTSFRTIQELKYYIRDRNPLISMAALGPAI